MKSLESYYKKAVILPSIIVILSSIAYGIWENLYEEKFKSEWLDANAILEISTVVVIANALFICILTLPLFLNNVAEIRKSIITSLLAWCLCPGIWIVFILRTHYQYLVHHSYRLDRESVFVLSNTLPYIIGLVWVFLIFRKDLNAAE